MTIQFLNPEQPPDIQSVSLAPRLETLAGKTVALMGNNKTNAAKLLRYIADELDQDLSLKAAVVADKSFAGSNCPPALLEELAGKADAMITGLGD
jgi:hypothetical protein